MVGLHDRNAGVDVCRDISTKLSRSRLVVFERSAHFPDIEEPERYAAEVRRFLDS
ncbi:alpha/beta fold hydrolase [Thermaerobacter marianensis]|uniref:alpha/beta fold hydrolase n=1 Tax=Thermaerobacter marianensis TaxID=73919 RepID=UPI0003145DE6|nr:alpha/beta hydrolase [Thermaerobacter marianensis]